MHFLGLDVGGSRCRAEWWPVGARAGLDADGVQPAVHGVPAAVERLHAIVQEAQQHGGADAVVCAVAGAGDAATRAALTAALRERLPAVPIAVVGDTLAAAAAALREGPGVLLWAGTGSFAVARGTDDRLWRVGGRGWLAGDHGSAFDLVRRALTAALRAFDGLDEMTDLLPRLCDAFAAPSPERLGAVAQQLPPKEIAARAAVVFASYRAGDRVAGGLIAMAVSDLLDQAVEAAERAGLHRSDQPLWLGGGLLGDGGPLLDDVRQLVQVCGGWSGVRPLGDRAAAQAAAWLAHGWHRRLEPQRAWVADVAL